MQIEDFKEKFAGCLTTTPATAIESRTNFKKLEDWSSIMALIVIAMIDTEYGKTLASEDIKRAETIQDLFVIVQSK